MGMVFSIMETSSWFWLVYGTTETQKIYALAKNNKSMLSLSIHFCLSLTLKIYIKEVSDMRMEGDMMVNLDMILKNKSLWLLVMADFITKIMIM
jgi:hypothetical protein